MNESKGARLYKSVSANSVETLDYIVPDGRVLEIGCMGGDAGQSPDTITEIIWDADGTPDILLSTHGDVLQENLKIERTGDGSKVLRIRLTNDQNVADTIGGFWVGTLYG